MPAGLLDQVPDGYVQVVQWDVESLLNYDGLDDLQDEFLEAWAWVEEYGIFLDDVTKVVSANDDRSNSLWLLSGEFEWDDVRDDLDDVGFNDSEYRNVEVWEESSRGLTVGLLEDRGLVVISSPEDDGVKDVIRALQSGEGFLFEDMDLEITRVLSRVKVGFQMMAEEGCGEVDLRSCKGVAYSVGRELDGFSLDLEWVFLFRSDSSARSGSSDIEDYFEDEMPSEVDVEDVEQDGEFVVVRTTIDEEDLSIPSRITVVNVRPRLIPDVIFPTSTSVSPSPTTIPTAILPPTVVPTATPIATQVPTPTAVDDLPESDVLAGRFVLRPSDIEGDWEVVSNEEVPIEDALAGESSWLIQFSRTTDAGVVETLESRTTVYNSTDRVAEAYDGQRQEVLDDFLASQTYAPLPQLGFEAFYAFIPAAENKHTVWVRRKTVLFSIEVSVADLGGKVETIELAKEMDDRIASAPEFTS